MTDEDRALRKPPLPLISLQSRGARIAIGLAGLLLLLGWLFWYAMTPEKLPTNAKTVSANGVVDTPLYVGMFAASDGFDRTLRISGVKVRATTSAELTITPLLCRRGTVGVTTQPEQFCSDLVDPEGQRLVAGDSIVIKVESDVAAVAVVERVQIAYREDIRWDTQPAGVDKAIVTIAGRPDAAPEDGSTDSPTDTATPSGSATGSPSGSPTASPSGTPTGSPTGSPSGTSTSKPSGTATP